MGDLFHIEIIGGLRIGHLWPAFIIGPLIAFIFYHLALKDIFNPSPEVKEMKRLQKLERLRRKGLRELDSKLRKERSNVGRYPMTPARLFAQAVFYIPFAAMIAHFSNTPSYSVVAPDQALIKMSMTLPGQHKEKCRKRTSEEIAKLSPNMRAPMKCSRERWPVLVELKLDGKLLYREALKPVGLSGDGQSSFYENFKAPAGVHTMSLGIIDDGDEEKFNYFLEKEVTLEPAQVMVFSFNTVDGAIYTK